jgi:hypothetical protein
MDRLFSAAVVVACLACSEKHVGESTRASGAAPPTRSRVSCLRRRLGSRLFLADEKVVCSTYSEEYAGAPPIVFFWPSPRGLVRFFPHGGRPPPIYALARIGTGSEPSTRIRRESLFLTRRLERPTFPRNQYACRAGALSPTAVAEGVTSPRVSCLRRCQGDRLFLADENVVLFAYSAEHEPEARIVFFWPTKTWSSSRAPQSTNQRPESSFFGRRKSGALRVLRRARTGAPYRLFLADEKVVLFAYSAEHEPEA